MNLISIIIPTYNRAHLLGETLNSILAQTYIHWECIIVDDGSTDHTNELMEFYCERNARILFYHRPKERKKGANACRNYGFEKSRGKYIQWFDSDDLMVPEFLDEKGKSIEEHEVDFVISKTVNFMDPDPNNLAGRNENYYKFEEFALNNFNYVTQRINWLTPDFMGRKELVQKVKFNENLKSSQERNFFSKSTCYSVYGFVINKVLTKRRVHKATVQSNLKRDAILSSQEESIFYVETWKEISQLKPGSASEVFLLNKLMPLDENCFPSRAILKLVSLELLRQRRLSILFWYFSYKVLFNLTGRGFYFRNKYKSSI